MRKKPAFLDYSRRRAFFNAVDWMLEWWVDFLRASSYLSYKSRYSWADSVDLVDAISLLRKLLLAVEATDCSTNKIIVALIVFFMHKEREHLVSSGSSNSDRNLSVGSFYHARFNQTPQTNSQLAYSCLFISWPGCQHICWATLVKHFWSLLTEFRAIKIAAIKIA